MDRTSLITRLKAYQPWNEQEEKDREEILLRLDQSRDIFTRDNRNAHMTASAWIVNPARDRVLMVYHNIYRSWSWTGGHADGDEDLLAVCLREAREETGISAVSPVSEDIFSLEILTVDGHVKRGAYVSSHLHLNLTWLLEADDSQVIHMKEDENSGVKWFGLPEALDACTEPWMVSRIYTKLNEKLKSMNAAASV